MIASMAGGVGLHSSQGQRRVVFAAALSASNDPAFVLNDQLWAPSVCDLSSVIASRVAEQQAVCSV
eukprot:438899-Rhodomonas_salina.1